jgi:hypothetical protein
MRTVSEIQAELDAVATRLEGFRGQLGRAREELDCGFSPEMTARKVAPSLQLRLADAIETLLEDHVEPAVLRLRQAASISAQEVSSDWESEARNQLLADLYSVMARLEAVTTEAKLALLRDGDVIKPLKSLQETVGRATELATRASANEV